MRAVAGVDGGGSGTRALLLDEEGREIGYAEGPPGRVAEGGAEAAADAVEETLRAAASAAGAELPLARIRCGLAGAGREEASRAVRAALLERGLSTGVGVGTDVEVAFRDAFGPRGDGALLLVGTGSVAAGRVGGGPLVRVGGWGPLLGDEGSAYRIGLDGLRAVLRAHDGRGPETELRDRLLLAVGSAGPEALVPFAGRASRAEVAALAPEVMRAAKAGDPAARAIAVDAVRELAAHVDGLFRRLGAGPGALAVVLGGGAAGPGGSVGDRLAAALRRAGHEVERRSVRGERGAARTALEELRRGEG